MNIKKYSNYIGSYINSGSNYQFNIGYNEDTIACYIKDGSLYVITEETNFDARMKKLDITILDSNSFLNYLDDDFVYLDKQEIYSNSLSNYSNGNNIQMNLITTSQIYLFFKKIEKRKEDLREDKIKEITNEN